MNQNLLKRVTVKKEGIFTHYHFPCNILPLFGWKIHVSVIPQNYLKIRRIVKQYCISQHINFKFITKKKDLLNSFSKFANPLFTGKYITIYPKDNHQAKTTLKKLYLQLKGEEGPRILTDKTYRNSIIQYRYGALLSSSTLTKKQKTDIREMGYYKPSGIEELFKNSKVKKKKINRYTPITVLKHNNFGGINVVTNNSEIFILKWSRNLMWYSKELNQIELRKQEIKLIRQTKKDFFPKFIESFNNQKIFFSVFEYKKGINLMDLAQMIHMQIVRANGKVEEKIENFLLLLIENIIQLLNYTREKSLILNDIKLSNFICCSDEKIVFIDLEHSFLPNSKYKPQIYNVLGKKESCPTWKSDVRKVGLMLINVISGSWPLENKFSSKEIIANHFKDFCKTFKVKDIITKNVLSFLNFKKGDNLSIKQTKLKPFEEIKTLAPEIKIKLMNTKFWDYEIREGIKSLKKIKIFWKKIIKLLNEKKFEKTAEHIKDLINKNLVQSENYMLFWDKEENKYLYFLDGGGTLLVWVMLKFKETFANKMFDEKIKEMLRTLTSSFSLKLSFMDGTVGMIYVILKAYLIFRKEEYLNFATMQLRFLKRMFCKRKGNYFNHKGELLTLSEREKFELLLKICNI